MADSLSFEEILANSKTQTPHPMVPPFAADILNALQGKDIGIGARLNRGIANANTLGMQLQTPNPEVSPLVNALRSIGGGGMEMLGSIGQTAGGLKDYVFTPQGEQEQEIANAGQAGDAQLRDIISLFSEPQNSSRQLLNLGPNPSLGGIPQEPQGAGTDLSAYFDLLGKAQPQAPTQMQADGIKKSHMQSGMAQALLALANSRDMTTGGGIATIAGALLGAKSAGEAAVEERLMEHDAAMQKHNLLLAQGKLTEARIAKQEADAAVNVGYQNQMREWEQSLRQQEANRPKIMQSSGGTMIVEETDPDTNDRVVNAYNMNGMGQTGGMASALGGRIGKSGKLAEAAQVRTPAGRIGFVVDQFMQTMGDAGISQVFGLEALETLNEEASEIAVQTSAQITDPKMRDQIFRDARAQLLWQKATSNPAYAVQMIQIMNGIQ